MEGSGIGQICKKGLEVQLLHSAAGYYLGTADEMGFPNCRLSSRYAATKEMAKELKLDRQIGCIENEYCNGGTACFTEQEVAENVE